MSAAPPMMDLQHVDLDFGGGVGVFDLNFQVPEGTILGMIGPSGCGKTTTVRLLTGLQRPTRGTVTVLGKTPSTFKPREREQLGYIPQSFVLYPNLSVNENLNFVASMYGLNSGRRQHRMAELLDFVELSDARHRLGRNLSGGMQRRLMLAGALMHDPKLLFADEPTAGIDPVLRRRFWDYFKQLRDEGRTLLVTTQYVGDAAYCDYVAVMRKGRVLTVDTPEGLRRQAMSAEIIELTVEPDRLWEVNLLLWNYPGVQDVEPVPHTRDQVRLYVADAGEMLPIVLSLLNDQLNLTPHKAEPYTLPFDDVFIKLMERSEAEDAHD